MNHYYKDYQNAEVVKCRTIHAGGFTVGKIYQVEETKTKIYRSESGDGMDCKFTDIYLTNDEGRFVNAAEPTDFEIIR